MENCEHYFVVLPLILCRICDLLTLRLEYGFMNFVRYVCIMMICKMCSYQ